MWFLMTIAVISIIWLLYVIAKNTSENLELQRTLLAELKNLQSSVRTSIDQSASLPSMVKTESKTEPDQSPKAQSVQDKAQRLTNINAAELDQLQALPGIGKAVAQRIIDGRPYATLEDLKKVSGIGEELFNKLKAQIEV